MMDDHWAIELFTGRWVTLQCAAPARIVFSGSILNTSHSLSPHCLNGLEFISDAFQ